MASRRDKEPTQAAEHEGATEAASALDTWLGPKDTAATGAASAMLSIVYHPELDRVGEQRALHELGAGESVLLSRTAPDFVSFSDARRPLADRNISRSPIRISAITRGGIRIELGECRTRVAVRSVPLQDSIDISAESLRRGVVLELAGRVVLLLHDGPTASATGAFTTSANDPITDEILGQSERIRQLRHDIRRVADLDVPVLVRGETGSGKELVARAIHRASARRDAPFVAVNLGAISAQVAVAELFGYEKGAFTGADRRRSGYFQQANGGTLFLDEIGEAPPEIQVSLLRALENGEIMAVGAQQPQKVDVRIVAATDADLETKIANGHFRAPLLHRTAAYEISVPPLRERRDDIGRLLVHFLKVGLEEIQEEHRITSPPPTGELWFPASLAARLVDSDWPGNVRQFRNVMRQILIGSRGRSRASTNPAVERQLQSDTRSWPPPREIEAHDEAAIKGSAGTVGIAKPVDTEVRRKPADVGEDELVEVLRQSRWDLAKAATLLGISRTSVYALVEASPRLHTGSDLKAEEITRVYQECGGDVERMVERLEVSARPQMGPRAYGTSIGRRILFSWSTESTRITLWPHSVRTANVSPRLRENTPCGSGRSMAHDDLLI